MVEALGQGFQSLVIRKGGLQEKNDSFEVEQDRFVLFPTYVHQKPEDLNNTGRQWLETHQLKAGVSEPNPVTLNYFAEIQSMIWMNREVWIAPLADLQALNQEALKKKFYFGNEKGFYVLTLRVYAFKETIFLPRLHEYAGCRSWLTLPFSIAASEGSPVLTDAEFSNQGSALTRLFGNHHG